MSKGHTHARPVAGHELALRWALGLTATFMMVEVFAGIVTSSLALISDAAHMFTDTAALAISLAAVRLARRPVTSRLTFGYHRFEILAAAFNALLLFGVAIYILVEAYGRFRNPPEVQSLPMLVVAALGLIVNLISMRLLSTGQQNSLNVKGAYLEVWSDLLGSIGVIVGALVIRYTGWIWVDTAIAVGIGLWVLPRTWTLLKSTLNVLLEGVPEGMDLEKLDEAIRLTPGVTGVHDLHVWSLTSGKPSLTVHVVFDTRLDPWTVLSVIQSMLVLQFGLHHVTIQLERTPCEQAQRPHSFSVGALPTKQSTNQAGRRH
ncbi:cation diffusion facilitator family transporter [Ralstonia sp.]|uniref:cation diffusion facilitator family transporter n=1 Tax=Ralstonia sp. TaxID=54061 RepID=UPI00257E9399|nr:cation diffusion facilitator family transporter [Ralstonia sp.]MBA4280842.1 cation transporter [Ralstonia sp.]